MSKIGQPLLIFCQRTDGFELGLLEHQPNNADLRNHHYTIFCIVIHLGISLTVPLTLVFGKRANFASDGLCVI